MTLRSLFPGASEDAGYAICACGHYAMQHDPDCLVCLWQTSAGRIAV